MSRLFRIGSRLLWLLALLQLGRPAYAQLCTGSLGDPTVHITFGAGSNPGSGVSNNNYTFTSTDCPPDGSYTIRNNTSGCFGASWHNVSQDHTPGDVNGYFMLVNASYNPGVFYLDTVKGLCEGTTYEFAAWVLNVLMPSACGGSGIRPNLTFDIEQTDGTKLATYNSGDIPATASPEWKQYGVFFTTPVGVNTVVIRLTNNAPGGCGNDLALDDITFRPCGPDVQAQILQSGGQEVDLCEGDNRSFDFSGSLGSGYLNPVYLWQLSTDSGRTWSSLSGASGPSYNRQPTGPGDYRYRLTVAESANAANNSCRVASNDLHLHVFPLPVPDARINTPLCYGDTLVLSSGDGSVFSWTGPAGFSSTDSVVKLFPADYNQNGWYRVRVTSAQSCVQNDSVEVSVHPNPVADAGMDQNICEGGSVSLQASGGSSYLWIPAAGLSSTTSDRPMASPADSTTYIVTAKNDAGCTDTASVRVNVNHLPAANAGPDLKIMEGDTVILAGAAGGTAVSWYWEPPAYLNDFRQLQPLAFPVSDITYTLHVQSQVGCGEATDKVFVRVFKKVKVPNAFSPNGDGVHDLWFISNLDTYPEATVTVFNRYGQAVFRSQGYTRPWDGRYGGQPLPVGVYYYVIDLKNGFPLLKGSLTLLR